MEIRSSVARNDRWISVLDPFVGNEDVSAGTEPRSWMPFDNEVRASQAQINSVIGSYVLPLVASILGVCIYVLRESSAKFATLSFAAREVPSYLPRFILGVVGGLLIGWFVDASSGGAFAAISPAAVAFVVGYSVELFFNILDALLKTLGTEKERPTGS